MQCSHDPAWASLFLAGCDRWDNGWNFRGSDGVFHACARLLGGWQVTRFFQIPVMLPRGTPETTL